MTSVEAAEQFGLGPSRVLDLLHGKWEKFSLEMLIMLAAKAGRQIQLELVT
jgi:predicted XRE-type DNA-binding protein